MQSLRKIFDDHDEIIICVVLVMALTFCVWGISLYIESHINEIVMGCCNV